MTHHVILGAGPAGVIAAETLRKHATNDTITLVGDEPDAPYSRMAIPYLLIGNIDERGTYLRKSATHFDDLRITQVKAKVTRVDAAGKTVQLDNGQSISFDKLLIATGSHPVRPPIAGMDLPGVHPCWTLEDARAIQALAKPGARVLQMGAGFIGCIIMEALASRGVKLSVVEMGDRMVPRMMGPVAGGMIRDWCEAKGVQVFTGTKVEAISQGAEKGLLGKLASAVGLGSDDASGALHAQGRKVICYFSAGSWEPYRPDSGDYPNEVMGGPVEGWPDERWLDVRRVDLLRPLLVGSANVNGNAVPSVTNGDVAVNGAEAVALASLPGGSARS